jgi:hypothetical protein
MAKEEHRTVKRKMSRKGMYFTVDAIIGVSIIFVSLMLITSFHIVEKENKESSIISSDVVRVFTMTKVGEVDNAYVLQLIANGTIKKPESTIFEQLGDFWASGQCREPLRGSSPAAVRHDGSDRR